ncbi:BLOC-1-related complex subunit 6 [Bombina bombina]|uniref:BLOC-1-related complex subunit 6 n=1 Tax=Bombina bombina TaxID=8345 RepID=UPI00235A7764|nr:BLOC-1-related complex subunit 6 [Bombina bombina]
MEKSSSIMEDGEGRRKVVSFGAQGSENNSDIQGLGTVQHDHFHKGATNARYPALRRKKADIPPIDPEVIKHLEIHAHDVAFKVDQMMKSLSGTIQNMTALSVGYIQTYRDSVDSLGESVDMSIKGMYTLMARCEELDRSMQPIHSLAKQIREIKRTLEIFESICK